MEKGEKLTLSGLQHFAFCRHNWAQIPTPILEIIPRLAEPSCGFCWCWCCLQL